MKVLKDRVEWTEIGHWISELNGTGYNKPPLYVVHSFFITCSLAALVGTAMAHL